MSEKTKQKDTKTLRVINWIFSIALIFGSLIMIFKATQTGTLYLLLFLIIVMGAYIMPAILLYSGTSKIFSFPIVIDKKNKLIYKISIAANFLFLLLGVGIILTSVYTGQYIIAILGFIITLLSFANVKALDICVKELSNV
ncbi:hypothetical protein OAR97_04195 [Arcobacteraceae bacterium]|jgi:hypothetical protein|nr:hypothetical protein [Arcobacteraceae bacterium]